LTAQNASAGFRPGSSEPGILAPEESEQVADDETPAGQLRDRTLRLHAVAVPAAALLQCGLAGVRPGLVGCLAPHSRRADTLLGG
jgi:hypothetical protein